jgi:hypothetical protein
MTGAHGGIDLEAIGVLAVINLRTMRLAPRCSGCNGLLTDAGGFDMSGRLRWCVPCSVAIDLLRGAAA